MNSSKTPLCVDLDGTLVLTDTMWEAFFTLLKQQPFRAFELAWLLKRGRGYGKHHIASQVSLIIDLLPYNQPLIEWLTQEKAHGRSLYLVTGSNEKFARQVAQHVDIFDGVIASTHEHVMTGKDKADTLIERFGDKKFAYVGNSKTDVHVWQHATEAVVVNASPYTLARAKDVSNVTKTLGSSRIQLPVLLRAIRWHQWIKNLLIFVPALTAHRLLDISVLTSSLLAFISFSAIASAVYLMNDLSDIAADRQNEYKKHRPIASGKLSILFALKLGVALGIISLLIAGLLLPSKFLALVLIYAIINIAYSLSLKRVVGVDVILITSLYVLRILAGSAATGIVSSPWLLAFAGLVFLSLALVKRVSELTNLNGKKAVGRGYHKQHLVPLTYIGMASSATSLIVLAFYMGSPSVQGLYEQPLLLWFLLPLFALWLARVWKVTRSGHMHEDPTVFAGKDAISHAIGIAAIIIVFLAT